ncbi:MAG: TauD/TfdA family dioxygenase [Gammaproteobacteria bacterium]|nr:TauD/TfdA family dioxygenase [Gammaproteobacteria bacterium]
MLKKYKIDKHNATIVSEDLVKDWSDTNSKVFVIRALENIEDVRSFYEMMFPLLGTPVALAEDVNVGDRSNQRTGKLWMEVRYDPRYPDAYRHSPNAQPLHTDGSYIPSFPNSTMMCCVSNAKKGGETLFVNAKDIAAALNAEDPFLLSRLTETAILHSRSGDSRNLPAIYKNNDKIHLNWNYYCVAKDANDEVKKLAEKFHQFLLTSEHIKQNTISIKLNSGDAVLWKDSEVLHGRNAFSPSCESERFIWKCAFNVGVFQ